MITRRRFLAPLARHRLKAHLLPPNQYARLLECGRPFSGTPAPAQRQIIIKRAPRRTGKKLTVFLAVLGGAVVLYVASCVDQMPVTGRLRLIFWSTETEKMFGDQAFSVFRRDALPPNHKYSILINDIGRRLQGVCGETGFNWEYIVVEDPAINAMCLPGGKVVFFTGLLQKMEKKGEVAAIMAHEIAHALCRHHAERSAWQAIVSTAYLFVSVITGVNIPVFLVDVGLLRPYSRTQETEADVIGQLLMARACYDPQFAISAHQRMAKHLGDNGSLTKYLSTHPNFADRIKQLKQSLPKAERERARFCPKLRANSLFGEEARPIVHKWYEGLEKD